MSYSVRLELFEGPLDLLLYLIRKNEIEITEIPIADITEQFLGQLEEHRILELDSAGEYLLMAATLLRIKSRMLLPRHGEEEGEDPRSGLVQQLEEYKKYREIAGQLRDLAEDRSQLHDYVPDIPLGDLRSTESVLSFDTMDLLRALRNVMGEMSEREAQHHVELEKVTIEEKSDLLRERVRSGDRFRFRDLFSEDLTRTHAIVTFMAILELMRDGEICVLQQGHFAEIWIERKEAAQEAVMARAAGA
ncbi:MAG: segregation/condensation protein A [Candidatus Krumholzibacteria bacterium]|nr:segregation/condensation protein A [Candidatus Krumholzibacteria bacterium]MDP6668782.1 segregation/condensation protein A [Candidatus Krumholzibacteria bacterium]MDP6797594.1 segregation/condensation protein A [Candidatus Krumholzibacteria bacterium]MDP7020909.1 segregation/condensation protein A [Candidatus Krumholzibacteria bacterium]